MGQDRPCNQNSMFGTTKSVKDLAGWICHNYKYQDPLTHLKLQKLVFYCYGALLASDFDREISMPIEFEPWNHGPVNRDLYNIFRHKKSFPIYESEYPANVCFSGNAEDALKVTLNIYGAMSAWSLRHQTHLEEPWISAHENKQDRMDFNSLRIFFKKKFNQGPVEAPNYLFGSSNFAIDGVPVQSYSSMQQLSEVVDRVFSDLKKR